MQKKLYTRRLLGLICLCHSFVQAQNTDSLQVERQLRQIDSLMSINEELQNEIKLLRKPPQNEAEKLPDIRLKLTGRAILTSGNINRSFMETRLSLSYEKPRAIITLDMNPRFAYGRQSGVLAERDYGSDFNISIVDYKRVHGIIFGFVERSNLRRINLRALAGAGLAWRVLRSVQYKLSVSHAIMYETTAFATDTKTDINITRNSTRLKGEYRFFEKKLLVKHLVLFQPAINTDNLRWSAVLTIELPITTHFSVQTSLDNSYESVVVEGRKNNDTRFTVGASIKNWVK